MTVKSIYTLGGFPARGEPQSDSSSPIPYVGHTHFWERAMSRRQFLQVAAGTAGVALGAGLLKPGVALARPPGTGEPNPIPGGIQPFPGGELFHVFPAVSGAEPSTITDFNGFVGVTNLRGMGTGTSTLQNTTERLIYDVDMRFMQGLYVGTDGRHRQATFGFI